MYLPSLPMPVVVQIREYGSAESYAQLSRGRVRESTDALESPETGGWPAPSAAPGRGIGPR